MDQSRKDELFNQHALLMNRIEEALPKLAAIWQEVSESPDLAGSVAGHKALGMLRRAERMLCDARGFHIEADIIANAYGGYPMPESGGR